MSNRRDLVLASLAGGAFSLLGYALINKLLNTKKETPKLQEASKIYEEKSLLDQYMLFNFAELRDFLLFDLGNYSDVTNCILFPKRVALLCKDYCPDIFFAEEVTKKIKINQKSSIIYLDKKIEFKFL